MADEKKPLPILEPEKQAPGVVLPAVPMRAGGHKIADLRVSFMDEVELTLVNGVKVHVSSRAGRIHMTFSNIGAEDIKVTNVCGNGLDIIYPVTR